MRLSSDFFATALIRRSLVEGQFAGLRQRGNAEAGAIFVLIDRLDGTGTLYGPAAQSTYGSEGSDRTFRRMHEADVLQREEIERRIAREIAFDPDCWVIEVESREGKHFLEVVD